MEQTNVYSESYKQKIVTWVDTAQAIDDIELQADLWTCLAEIEAKLGNFEQATQHFNSAIELIEQLGDAGLVQLIKAKGNRIVLVESHIDLRATIDTYLEIIDTAKRMNNAIGHQYQFIASLNIAVGYLLLCQYDDASVWSKRVKVLWKNPFTAQIDRQKLGAISCQMHRVDAMVSIVNQDYQSALTESRLLLELSKQGNYSDHTVSAYLLMVMIALRDSTHETTAEFYWEQADQLASPHPTAQTSSLHQLAILIYRENVKQFEYLGYDDWAARCAQKAKDIEN